MDVGLGAATTETPGERANITPFGTVLGGVGAAKGVAGRAISGHIIAPRAWGSEGVPQRPDTFTQNFPALNAEHTDAMANAPVGVQQRFNAVQKFVDGAAPGTQIVYAPRPEVGHEDTLPAALQQSGINPKFAARDGFSTKVQGTDGKTHNIVVVRDMEAAPHEARHAMDDVIGAGATADLNATAKQEFADKWDAFKQRYADRLTPTGLPTSDPNGTILRESGYGDAAAKEKIISQARDALGPNATEAQVHAEAGKAITDLRGQAKAAGQELWQHVLTPDEQSNQVDQYVGSEVRAEHHDAWFKAGQPGTMRGKMGMLGGRVLSALGINPVEGRSSTYGTPLEGSLVSQAQKTAPEGVMAPEAPAPEGSDAAHQKGVVNAQKAAAEASGQPVAGAVKSQKEVLGIVAEAIARKQGVKLTKLSAPEEPAASLTSDRETRRQMIETYRTMPDAAKKLWGKLFFPTDVPVTGRGGNLQIFGYSPEVFAANAHKTAEAMNTLADKGSNLSPYELDPATKSFTESGWRELYDDVQKYVQNQAAGRTGSGTPLSVPAAVTAAGGHAPPLRGEAAPLTQDRADFISAMFHAKLPDTGIARQGAINMPLNKAGQLVSAATIPGRVAPPVEPRGSFRGAVAVRQGVKGEPIMEVNPFRNKFESALKQAGVEKPSLIEANQRLNLKDLKDAELAPEQGKFGANSLALQAGFQPRQLINPEIESRLKDSKVRFEDGTLKPVFHSTVFQFPTKEIRTEGFQAHFGTPDQAAARSIGPTGNRNASALQSATGARTIPAFLDMKNPLRVDDVGNWANAQDVATGLEKAGVSLPKELSSRMINAAVETAQDKLPSTQSNQDEEDSWGQANQAVNSRLQNHLRGKGYDGIVYANHYEDSAPKLNYGGRQEEHTYRGQEEYNPSLYPDSFIPFDAKQIHNAVDTKVQYQPSAPKNAHELTDFLDKSSPEEYKTAVNSYKGKYGGGQTGMSFDTGAQVSTADELAKLHTAHQKFQQMSRDAMAHKDFNTAMDMASRSQAAREAYEAAENGPSAAFIRDHYDKNFQGSPLHKGTSLNSEHVNFMPKGDPRAIRAAAVQDADNGKIFEGPMHFYAHSQMIAAGYNHNDLFRHPQGFVTNTPGEFLDRQQAFKRAEELNQLKGYKEGDPDIMHPTGGLAADNLGLVAEHTQMQPPKKDKEIELTHYSHTLVSRF
jgi:hypothetical protein